MTSSNALLLDPCDNGETRSFVRPIEPRSSVAEPATKKENNDEHQIVRAARATDKETRDQPLNQSLNQPIVDMHNGTALWSSDVLRQHHCKNNELGRMPDEMESLCPPSPENVSLGSPSDPQQLACTSSRHLSFDELQALSPRSSGVPMRSVCCTTLLVSCSTLPLRTTVKAKHAFSSYRQHKKCLICTCGVAMPDGVFSERVASLGIRLSFGLFSAKWKPDSRRSASKTHG